LLALAAAFGDEDWKIAPMGLGEFIRTVKMSLASARSFTEFTDDFIQNSPTLKARYAESAAR
jgi:hypothetical protein